MIQNTGAPTSRGNMLVASTRYIIPGAPERTEKTEQPWEQKRKGQYIFPPSQKDRILRLLCLTFDRQSYMKFFYD